MPFKLVVSPRVEFDVKFSLRDGQEDRKFGMVLSAERTEADALAAEREKGTIDFREFLAARGVQLVRWIDKAPLVDQDTGEAVPPTQEALDALLGMVAGLSGLCFNEFLGANGARGKSGN